MLIEFVSSLLHRRSPKQFHVRVATSWPELVSWRDIWKSLYEQTADATFLQSWEWFDVYWRHFGNNQSLRVALVEDLAGTPIGIVPLTIQTELCSLGKIRRLSFPLNNWGTRYGPLGRQPFDSLTAALGHAKAHQQEWDVIDLRWISIDQCADVRAAGRRAGLHLNQKLWNRTATIELSQGWESYWNGRSSKWRNNHRRADKALADLGNVQVMHFCPSPGTQDPNWDCYDVCESVASESWQGACPSGNTLNHPTVRSFLREVHVAAVRLGCVHLSLLFVNDRAAAFTYNYVARGITIGLRMGYDLRFQAAGAGNVLLRETIRECCRRGGKAFDLGEGPSPYKQHWANQFDETFRFCHYSQTTPLGNALRLRGWFANPGQS